MRKKILIITPYSKDANSYWRCMGPWSYLAKHSRSRPIHNLGEVEIELGGDSIGKSYFAWDNIAQMDAIFFHRPCRKDDLIILEIAKQYKIPTWADYDDWLFELPISNPAHMHYSQPEIQKIIYQCIQSVDLVSVTTEPLYEKIKAINPNTVKIPNAYRSDLFKNEKKDDSPRNPVFTWRGTNTHDADLLSVSEAFEKLPAKVHFMGNPAWQVYTKMSDYQLHRPQDNLVFLKNLSDLKPKVMLVPLQDNFFNRCKSNIAWMEAVHAGAVTVAPAFPEWQQSGVIHYEAGNADSFLKAAQQAIALSEEEHKNLVKQAFDAILYQYDISYVNELRTYALRTLFNPSLKESKDQPLLDLESARLKSGAW